MAFFKFRKASAEPTRTPPASQSIEVLRQRAKYRLAGASVLVLLGVIGFPLLFDKQPRSVAVDTPIDIPDRNKVQPLVLPPLPSTAQPTASAVPGMSPVASAPVPPALPEPAAKPKQDAASQATAKLPPAKPSSEANASKPAASAASKSSEAAKAQALLEDKSAPPAGAGRFVVQVGAFADADRAREVRAKLEKAGLKTYTNVAETKDGPRTRVRVGPFASKPEAKKAAEKIKQLNLPAAVLTL